VLKIPTNAPAPPIKTLAANNDGAKSAVSGVGLFGSYFALFVLAAKSSQTFNNLPKRPLMQRNQLFNKQFLLYFFFFLLLFGLRSARLIKSNALFEWAITGFLFLFALLLITLTKRSRSWKQPLHLNVLTFIRGVIGNFLFLFGSVYVTGRFGAQALSTHVYLPYALGFFGAMFLGGKLAHRLEKQLIPTYLLGLMAGVLLFSSDTLIPISLFVISFFNAGLNQWLTKQYLTAKPEAIEQRSFDSYEIPPIHLLANTVILQSSPILLALKSFGSLRSDSLPSFLIAETRKPAADVQNEE